MQTMVAVSATTPESQPEAKALAHRLGLDYIADPKNSLAKNYAYLLLCTPDFLGLQDTDDEKLKPFFIDFSAKKLLYRVKKAGLRNELLAKAIGIHPREKPFIVDATAGIGRDAFILASLGYELTLIEQSPIIHALLKNGIERADKIQVIAGIIQHIQLINDDSINWLHRHLEASAKKPDIVYIDPMFPERKKSSSVKKEMAILNKLLGSDENPEKLLEAAIACAGKRVVVKRPRSAAKMILKGRAPNYSLSGTANRFDIYLT